MQTLVDLLFQANGWIRNRLSHKCLILLWDVYVIPALLVAIVYFGFSEALAMTPPMWLVAALFLVIVFINAHIRFGWLYGGTIETREENYAESTNPNVFVGFIIKNVSGDKISNVRPTLVEIVSVGGESVSENVNAPLKWSWTHHPEDLDGDKEIASFMEYKVDVALVKQTQHAFMYFVARRGELYRQINGEYLVKILISGDYAAFGGRSVAKYFYGQIVFEASSGDYDEPRRLQIHTFSEKDYEMRKREIKSKASQKEKPLTKKGFFQFLNKAIQSKPSKKSDGKRRASKKTKTSE